ASIVDLQHRIATAGEQLGLTIEAPVVAWANRATMRIDDQGQVLADGAVRNGQVGVDAHPVPRCEGERSRGTHVLLLEPLAALHQEPCLSAGAIVEIKLAWIAVAVH